MSNCALRMYRVDRDILIEAYRHVPTSTFTYTNVMRANRFPLSLFSELRDPATVLISGIMNSVHKVDVGVQKVLAK